VSDGGGGFIVQVAPGARVAPLAFVFRGAGAMTVLKLWATDGGWKSWDMWDSIMAVLQYLLFLFKRNASSTVMSDPDISLEHLAPV
jgi:hypothetical protein